MAHVAGNMVSINCIIVPVFFVVGRLAFMVRRHQQKIRQQEIKLADDENQFVEEMEAQEANSGKKKGTGFVAALRFGCNVPVLYVGGQLNGGRGALLPSLLMECDL